MLDDERQREYPSQADQHGKERQILQYWKQNLALLEYLKIGDVDRFAGPVTRICARCTRAATEPIALVLVCGQEPFERYLVAWFDLEYLLGDPFVVGQQVIVGKCIAMEHLASLRIEPATKTSKVSA